MRMSLLRLPAVTAVCAVTALCAATWFPAGPAGAASHGGTGGATHRSSGPVPHGAGPSPAACPTDPGLTITCAVVYGTDGPLTLTLDAYQPTASLGSALPAVVLIHGGEWDSGSNEGALVGIAEQLASAGLVTFSVNYTLDSPGNPSYPQAVNDVQTAVSFLHANPAKTGEWNINPAKIGAFGTSSGGYLAAMLATCTAQGPACSAPQVQAAALWSAPLNLTSIGCQTSTNCVADGKFVEQFLGCYLSQCPSTYSAASPSSYVTAGAAPMLLWNSDNEAIPVNQLSGVVSQLHTACGNYRFTVLPGNQHSVGYTDLALPATISFLQQQLGTSPPKLGCTTSPPWTDGATAFDPAAGGTAGEAVAFGGCCNPSGTLLATTRVLTSGTWVTQHPATSPPARIGASMAWDPASGQLILFGGETVTSDFNTALNDTWSWNGTTWTKLTPPASPPVRSEASLAYDSSTGKLVLFGGETPLTATTNSTALSDTWTWNGTTWSKVTTGTTPPARYGAAMASDPVSGHPILFGGDNATTACDVSCLMLLQDTWKWTGSAWQAQSPATLPAAREFAALAPTAGASSGSLVLFGGLNGTTDSQKDNTEALQSDTWTWQSGQWVRQHPGTSPPARYGTTMPDGPVTGDLTVLSGGFTGADTLNTSTYSWTGSTWVKTS